MIISVRGENGGPSMKITKNTKELPEGTIVTFCSGEMLRIEKYVDPYNRVYRVRFGEFDGEDFIPVGKVRFMPASELVGGEYEQNG